MYFDSGTKVNCDLYEVHQTQFTGKYMYTWYENEFVPVFTRKNVKFFFLLIHWDLLDPDQCRSVWLPGF